MTDDDVQLFLTLKFSSIGEVVEAFKKAIHVPKGHVCEIPDATIQRALKEWVKAGAPQDMTIPEDLVEFFLIVKFGSVKNAYYYWVNTPPGVPHGFSDDELKVVMDYVEPPRS